jgi:hypothetical protein
MNTYRVQYTEDMGDTHKTFIIQALDYTKAYLKASFALPITVIITSLTLI